jgi:Fe-S-cluster containining protein
MQPDPSRLCLACGLCCQGVLHDRVRLHPDSGDLQTAARLGLPVETWEGVPTFALPCSYYGPQGCSTYADRPATCQTYRCKLLDRHLAGEVDLDQALAMVEKVKAVAAKLRDRLGAELPGPALRRRLREILAAPDVSPESLLDGVTLFMLCQKHFHPGEGQKVESR